MKNMSSWVAAGAIVLLAGGQVGCASKDPAAAEAPAAAAVAVPIPADSPMAQITTGMTEIDVRKILGEPTRSRSYMTGKAWIPWYYGSDTARTAWTYAGQGEVVFSRNRYSGGLSVVRVDYNPSVQ
jgi:hypothetical protein